MSNREHQLVQQHHRRDSELPPAALKTKHQSQNLRIRTEPDCNENDAISRRINQIKNKYNIKERPQVPLGELNHEQLSNIGGVNIKEVDSPMNCLSKNSTNARYFGKNVQVESPSTTLARESSFTKDTPPMEHYSSGTLNDPRIQNIDKINMKIRNILQNFNVLEGKLLGREESPSAQLKSIRKEATNKISEASQTSHELKRHRDSTSYAITTKPPETRGKFDMSKHAYRDLYQEKPNVRAGKTESYGARPSLDYQLQRSNEFKELPLENCPYRIRRLSDFEEPNPRSSQTAPRPETAMQDRVVSTSVNKSVLSVFPKRERIHIEQPVAAEKTQSKKLFSALKKQVELDEQYRNKKYVFKQMRAENKLFGLLAELADMGVRIERSEQLANEMKISEEEFNPFYTSRGEGSYREIATAYIEAKKHWQEQVLGQFDHYKLAAEGFTERAVDLDRKGYLTVEDLVRLLNLQADTFVRNRDLVLLHRRLASNQLTFAELIRQLCE